MSYIERMDKPHIFHFTSLEAYLNQYVQYRKFLNPSFSYAFWARCLRVKSAATLHMVTNGQRSPGKNLVQKLQLGLGLGVDEARYFEILVDLKRQKGKLFTSIELMNKLEVCHPEQGFKLIDHDQFRLISNWYCWAILEMVSLKGFQESPRWIAEKLEYPVSVVEIQEALSTMERSRLLSRNRRGQLVRTVRPLKTTSDQASDAIKGYHSQSLKNSIESLNRHSVDQRNFESLTFSMSESQMPEAKKMIRTFVDSFCKRFDSFNASQVHQMSVALIPLTLDMRSSRR